MQQAAYLDELVDDLKFLINQLEGQLNMPRNADLQKQQTEPVTTERHVHQTIRMPDGTLVMIQVDRSPDSEKAEIKVDGKAIELTRTQLRLLQRHEDRINAIILEAARQNSPAAAARAVNGP